MSIQDRDQWIHECFAENYDILVVRAKRRAGNDPILRNEIEDCVIEAFEMAWSKYGRSSIIHVFWGGSRKRFITRLIIFGCAHRRRCLDRRRILMIRR